MFLRKRNGLYFIFLPSYSRVPAAAAAVAFVALALFREILKIRRNAFVIVLKYNIFVLTGDVRRGWKMQLFFVPFKGIFTFQQRILEKIFYKFKKFHSIVYDSILM